jgi:hypothetical protein
MPKWKTQNDPHRPAFGEHYQIEKTEYPFGARARPGGMAQPPQARSVESMKAPVKTTLKAENVTVTRERISDIKPTESGQNPEKVKHFERKIQKGEPVAPICVGESSSGKSEVIDGHHRLQAYKNLGIKKIPVVKRESSSRSRSSSSSSSGSSSSSSIRTTAQTKAEKAMIRDENQGAHEYLRLADGAEKEGRHEDAETFRAHAVDELRHGHEDHEILENPDALWMREAFKPEHKGALHRQLGLPGAQKIGRSHLQEIVNTPDGQKWHGHTVTPLMKKRAQAALNANP